jgi:Spy/CpxP family protein refolding chaperone
MKPPLATAAWALATVLLAGLTAFLVTRSTGKQEATASASVPGSEADFHQWMHDRLEITPDQHAALEPFEHAFETERERLRAEIAKAGRDLAEGVRKGDPASPEIEDALTRLNAAQAELQRATLDHFFAMKRHLDPAQAEKLLEWTHDSIVPE